ncbi:nuclear transport factor 2 family protein [Sphingomonas immobilis]|uniref:Nuclear transport factor 2 family protein n=1 Tax=Sphingomonas immobilis TaxID=3063997 RepID=A0ABT9A5Z7_9SPHN|nr:nuclear transport factor 2 family protein [Sphingomonas sp. CA1-15]MDO7844401.1 nuclear transport factor 2 family protein [Sphingomonas sp. CA1-15]
MSLLLAAALLAAPQKATDKLPPANPVPYTEQDTAAVLATVETLLGAIGTHDPKAGASVVRPEGVLTAAKENADGTRSVMRLTLGELVAAFASGPAGASETMSDPAVEIDGDIAMVWAPFVFRINGQAHHCGVNHFDLLRENGAWKIVTITYSSRTTGCGAQ